MENGGRKIVGEGARFSDLRVIWQKNCILYMLYIMLKIYLKITTLFNV